MRVRVVFDTNVVVSALLFTNGSLAWLRNVWRDGAIVPLLSRETVSELMRVLAYPKFRLGSSDIEVLLSEYLPFGDVVPANPAPDFPVCRDPDDQIFINLAFSGRAEMLVSGDAALLEMRELCSFAIVTPAEARSFFEGPHQPIRKTACIRD